MERIILEDVMNELKSRFSSIESVTMELKNKNDKTEYLKNFCTGLLSEVYEKGLDKNEIKQAENYIFNCHRTILLKYNLIGLPEK
jgi:hypothetical protein